MSADDALIYRTRVIPEWVDYNGHVRDAFYTLIFSFAVDEVMEAIGVDEPYRLQTKGTLYTLDIRIHYLKELLEGTEIEVESRLVAMDPKRILVWQALWSESRTQLHAVEETLMLHVSQAGDEPKVAPFPEGLLQQVEQTFRQHKALPEPPYRVGGMSLKPGR